VVVFLPVLVWNAEHDWHRSDSSLSGQPRPTNCRFAPSGIFVGLQFGLVGFILLPVVLSARRDGVAGINPTSPNCRPTKSPTVRSDNSWVAVARTNWNRNDAQSCSSVPDQDRQEHHHRDQGRRPRIRAEQPAPAPIRHQHECRYRLAAS